MVGIYLVDGTCIVNYDYDAWGNFEATYNVTNYLLIRVASETPFRYRGYQYDVETGFYYLNSRYYDAKIGRFINADSYVSTGQGLNGYNMFAYCNNNPVMLVDDNGQFAKIGVKLFVAVASLVVALIEPTPVGETVVCIGVLMLVAAAKKEMTDAVFESNDDLVTEPNETEEQGKNKETEDTLPNIEYPGDDPSVAPDGYEWRGPGKQGSKEGGYYNPENDSSLRPDLEHADPIGPHWDYSGPEGKFRIFPDGSIIPKK